MDPLYLTLALCVLVTYLWRGAGVALAQRIDPSGAVFEWIGCVAYGLLAGLMARVMVFPVGLLADTSLATRAIAMAAGFVVFYWFKRQFAPGTLVAIVVFYALLQFTAL
ncbi:MAG: AzlD domain-containing protein [Gammaproteobacteria bacterium]|nr:AzlD domain-containing protein [Gammaproteobacteria bacterium]